MISAATYTKITGDPAPDDFTALESRVVAQIEAVTRPLTQLERTEILTAYSDGIVYPSVRPVVSAVDLYSDNNSIDVGGPGTFTVTYTAGYTASSCPQDLQQAVAWGIYTTLHPNMDVMPPELQSMNVAGEFAAGKISEPGVRTGADGELMPKVASLASLRNLGGRCAELLVPYRRR